MIITVTEVNLLPGESVGTARGETASGSVVTFGLDHRMARDLIDAVDERGEVDCEVEPWQILST